MGFLYLGFLNLNKLFFLHNAELVSQLLVLVSFKGEDIFSHILFMLPSSLFSSVHTYKGLNSAYLMVWPLRAIGG